MRRQSHLQAASEGKGAPEAIELNRVGIHCKPSEGGPTYLAPAEIALYGSSSAEPELYIMIRVESGVPSVHQPLPRFRTLSFYVHRWCRTPQMASKPTSRYEILLRAARQAEPRKLFVYSARVPEADLPTYGDLRGFDPGAPLTETVCCALDPAPVVPIGHNWKVALSGVITNYAKRHHEQKSLTSAPRHIYSDGV